MPLGATTARPPATRIAITSGKGGVGKTSLTVNLAVAMARLGHRVGVLDADFALGNIDVMLGLVPPHHLGAVLDGEKTVDQITMDGPEGICVIPAGSGVRALASLTDAHWERLATAVDTVGRGLDFLLFDTASGISDNVLEVIGLADYVLVVTSYEPASVVDAYAVVKLVTADNGDKPIGIVVNGARDADEGALIFKQISLASERFLKRALRFDGHVLEDRSIKDSALAQVPVIRKDSDGPASRCIRRLAYRLTAARASGASPWPATQSHAAPPAAGEPTPCV